MLTLNRTIRAQRKQITKDHAQLKRHWAACRTLAGVRARSPVGLSLGFAGGFVLGLRRPAWQRDDADSLLHQGMPLIRSFLVSWIMGKA